VNLYISNFKNYYFKIATLIIVMIATYNMALLVWHPRITTFQSQWIANYSRAETYLYKNPRPKVIIVGSSMSARLHDDKLDGDVHNMSFGAGSVLTGLEIIKRSEYMPKLICVETNIIERGANEGMIKSLFTPVVWRMKKHLIVLQYTYQPMNIVLTLVNSRFGQQYEEQKNEKPNEGVFKVEIARHLEAEGRVDGLNNSKEICEIKELIEYFCSRGVKVMFFQMPVYKDIASSERYLQRKKILGLAFNDMNVEWSQAGNDCGGKYLTADGIHLTPRSAGEFTKELNHTIEEMLRKTR